MSNNIIFLCVNEWSELSVKGCLTFDLYFFTQSKHPCMHFFLTRLVVLCESVGYRMHMLHIICFGLKIFFLKEIINF